MDTIAHRYAKALFDIAKEEDKIDAYLKDINLIDEVFGKDRSTLSFFNEVVIQDKDKYQLIEQCFASSINGYVLNFLKLLIKKRRIRYLLDIIKDFRKLCYQELGIEEGIVYTPYLLSDSKLKELEEAMSLKEKKEIRLLQKLDESLIGGIKIQINTKVMDGSIKNKIENMKNKLLESR